MTVGKGRGYCADNAYSWISPSKGVYKSQLIPGEVVPVIRPVARIGIVYSNMDYGDIRAVIHRVEEFLLLHIWPVATEQKGGAGLAESPEFIGVSQMLAQLGGI